MIRNRRLNFIFACIAVSAALSIATGRADAQVNPFKITGGGLAPNGISLTGAPAPHWAVGVGTELGKYYGEGFFQFTNPAAGQFSSAPIFTFAAANGDLLVVTYGKGPKGAGVATLATGDGVTFTARFVAEFNPVPNLCTGRFKGVTGSWIMIAQSGPFTFVSATDSSPFVYTWQGEGTLTFPKR